MVVHAFGHAEGRWRRGPIGFRSVGPWPWQQMRALTALEALLLRGNHLLDVGSTALAPHSCGTLTSQAAGSPPPARWRTRCGACRGCSSLRANRHAQRRLRLSCPQTRALVASSWWRASSSAAGARRAAEAISDMLATAHRTKTRLGCRSLVKGTSQTQSCHGQAGDKTMQPQGADWSTTPARFAICLLVPALSSELDPCLEAYHTMALLLCGLPRLATSEHSAAVAALRFCQLDTARAAPLSQPSIRLP